MTEAYCRWNSKVLDDIIHPECAFRTVSYLSPANSLVGIEGAKKRLEISQQSFPEAEWNILEMFSGESHVVVHWHLRARHMGSMFGIPAKGAIISMEGMTLFKFKEGRINQIIQFFDSQDVVNQLEASEYLRKETQFEPWYLDLVQSIVSSDNK